MGSPLPFTDRIAWFHEARFGLFVHWGFDGSWVDIGRKKVNEAEFWEAEKLLSRIYEWQPHILVNNRLGMAADLDTPEQHVTASSPGRRRQP